MGEGSDLYSAPFLLRERGFGKKLDFGRLCRDAGFAKVVTIGAEPEVRLHDEADDWIVALPGRRGYLMARRKLPAAKRERARAILDRLAYGAHDWAAREIVLADRRRQRDDRIVEGQEDERRRRLAAETLPLRRVLRREPGAGDERIAEALGTTVDAVKALRNRLDHATPP